MFFNKYREYMVRLDVRKFYHVPLILRLVMSLICSLILSLDVLYEIVLIKESWWYIEPSDRFLKKCICEKTLLLKPKPDEETDQEETTIIKITEQEGQQKDWVSLILMIDWILMFVSRISREIKEKERINAKRESCYKNYRLSLK